METRGVVDVAGAQLHIVSVGTGPPLIVISGGPGFGYHYLYGPLTEQLATHRRLTFYDPRGSGSSSGHEAAATLTMETFVQDLDGIRDAIGADDVDLLGHSFGGLLALHYALRYPNRVAKLIIVDGDPVKWEDWAFFRGVLEARRRDDDAQRLAQIQAIAEWSRQPALAEEYFRVFLRPYFGARDLSGALTLGFDSTSVEKLNITSAAVRQDLGHWDLTAQLSRMTAPTLLVYGGRSIFRPGSAEALHAALPVSELEIMQDVGHFPFLEDPATFRSVIAGFLDR